MSDEYISRLKGIVKKNEKELMHIESDVLKIGYKSGIIKTKEPKHKKILGKYSEQPGDYLVEYIPQENAEAEKILNSKGFSITSDSRNKGYAMAIANKLMGSKRSMES